MHFPYKKNNKKIRMISPNTKHRNVWKIPMNCFIIPAIKSREKKKSKKDKKNLKEIKKSMSILSDMISCEGDFSKLRSSSTTITAKEKEFLHE